MNRWHRLRDYIVSQLSQASTWRGLVLVYTAFVAQLEPSKAEGVIALGLLVAGGVAVLFPDDLPRK